MYPWKMFYILIVVVRKKGKTFPFSLIVWIIKMNSVCNILTILLSTYGHKKKVQMEIVFCFSCIYFIIKIRQQHNYHHHWVSLLFMLKNLWKRKIWLPKTKTWYHNRHSQLYILYTIITLGTKLCSFVF